jgi:ArsR family transcriptional regulator, cadmium/lead-responsive transcriptional repressor
VNGEVHRGQASCGSVTCASRFLIGPVAITWSRLDVLLSVAGTRRERDLMPGGMTAQTDDEPWSAIADPSRRQVLDLLVSNGEASASRLAGRVPISRQAVSEHLGVLERAGLVSRRKQRREVLYQVEARRLDQATRAMAELAAQWDRRLAAIKTLAEAAHAESKRP